MSGPSEESKVDSKWRSLEQDARSQIEHQIEERRWLQNHAARSTRVLLTLFGVIVTTGSVIATLVIAGILNLQDIISVNEQKIGSGIADLLPVIQNAESGTGVLGIAIICALSYSISALWSLFAFIPSAEVITRPVPLQRGLKLSSYHRFRNIKSNQEAHREILDEYYSHIDENEDRLKELYDDWESYHHHLSKFGGRAGNAIGLIAVIAVENAFLIVFMLFIVLAGYIYRLSKKFPHAELREIFNFEPLADTLSLLFILNTWVLAHKSPSTTPQKILAGGLVLLLLGIVYSIYRMGTGSKVLYGVRQVVVLLGSFASGTFIFMLSDILSLEPPNWLFSAIISVIFASFCLTVIYLVGVILLTAKLLMLFSVEWVKWRYQYAVT